MQEPVESSSGAKIAGRHSHMTSVFETMALSLGPFLDERMRSYFSDESSWLDAAANRMGRPTEHGATDPLFQLLVLRRFWGPVFQEHFGSDLRPLINRLIEARNLWAHFSLPDNSAELDQLVLAAERIVAPVDPEGAVRLRTLRTELRQDKAAGRVNNSDPKSDPDESSTGEVLNFIEQAELAEQLSETERVFEDLQGRYSEIESELEESQRHARNKQLKLQSIERELVEISGRSDALEMHLTMEKNQRDRIEWLFVGLITALLVAMLFMT